MARVAYPRVTSGSRDLDNIHGLVEGMVSGMWGLRAGMGRRGLGWRYEDTKLASLEQKQDIATRGVLLLCSFVSRGLQGNPGNQELLKVSPSTLLPMHQGLAHMPQMAVLQSATGKGITLQLSPALPCAPAICFPLILSGPGGHGLADMSQMAVPQLAAGKGAPAGGAVGLSGLKELEFISSALESSVHHTGNLPLDPAYTYQPTRQASYQASTAGLERQTSASATAPAAAGIASRHSFGAGGAAAAAAAAAAIATVSGRSRGDSVSGLGVGVGGGGGAGMHGLGPERGMHGAAAAHGLHTAAPAAAQGLHASGATAEAAVVQSVREAGDVVLRRGVVIEEVGDGREGYGRPRPANEVSPPRAREGVPGGYPPRKLRHARFGD
ncbi:unnamed protein product [Closterium sp. NIES-64]|nr:unnamed protein product [Closterium sp. NIES-64]